jgi:ABC-type transport system involved in cytochrome c biogenesis permease subunit
MTDPALILNGLLGAAAAGFLFAGGAFVRRRPRPGRAAAVAAWLCALAALLLTGHLVHAPPFGNMFQVLVVLALCFLPLYAWLAWRDGLGWTAAYFAFAALAPLLGAVGMDKDTSWRRLPALQSPWFVPHVTAYMIAYALAAVALAITAAGQLRGRRNANATATHGTAACQVLRLAFPFMTFGLLSGALWAEQAWGRCWSWDPKETWSLITWLLYALYLHSRAVPALRRHADWIQLLAFLALLTTFLVVNLAPRFAASIHSYA